MSFSYLVARGGQAVVVFDAGQFHRQQVLLSAGSADDEGNVIRRAGCRAETFHLLHEERNKRSLVLYGGLRHRIEVGLVGRSATLGYHHEAVFSSFSCLNVNLCR